ncbi:hypothetical protein [Desulfobacca acetoxidans]
MVSRIVAVIVTIAWLAAGCASYRPQATPFRLPQSYANVQHVNGLDVAAYSWSQEEEAKGAFGFDIIRAGLLPVQVVFDNQSPLTLQINPSQTFLVNDRDELFTVLDNQGAYDRVSRATDFQESIRGLAKGAFWGAAAGALIGAAIGVAAGRSAGDYAMRGAATGGAAGAVLGAGRGAGDTEVPRQISDDLANRSLKNNPVKPYEITQGIIFFPAEAGRPTQLRLQLKDKDTDKIYNLKFFL